MMESSVMVQCLEFSRLLISNQKAFQFEVKLASGFYFNFNTLDQEPTKSRTQEVRKKSPSTLKRNAARKLRFLQDKKTSSEKETLADSFNCDQCEHQANCKASLRKHVGNSRRALMIVIQLKKHHHKLKIVISRKLKYRPRLISQRKIARKLLQHSSFTQK